MKSQLIPIKMANKMDSRNPSSQPSATCKYNTIEEGNRG
jgi:hypothetical protein